MSQDYCLWSLVPHNFTKALLSLSLLLTSPKIFALGLAKIFVDVRNSEIYAGFCKIFLKYQRHTGLLVRFLGNIEPQKYNGTFVHK